MLTLQDLITSRKQLRKNIPAANPCQLKRPFLVPLTRDIVVPAIFEAKTDKKGLKHNVVIMFRNLSIEMERDDDHPMGFEVLPDQWLYVERPSLSKTDIGVVCTCSDYYFTWWKWNKEKKAYIGGPNMPAYQRKTPPPPKGYPYKNPDHVPGVCKHILYTTLKISEIWLRR